MKSKNNFFNLFSIKIWTFIVVLAVAFLSCEPDPTIKLSLAVNNNEIVLTAESGKTHVMVYSTGEWAVSFKEHVDWASIDKVQGKGNGSVLFSYSQNFGVSRKVILILKKGEETQEISILQEGKNPTLQFVQSKVVVSKDALPVRLELKNNLKYGLEDIQIDILYDDETSENWISEIIVSEDAVEFYALENHLAGARSARLTLAFTDGKEDKYVTFIDIEQTIASAYLNKDKGTSEFTKIGGVETVLLEGNVKNSFHYMELEVKYTPDLEKWVSSIEFSADALSFEVADNETGVDRSAVINFRLKNKNGEVFSFNHLVTQLAEAYVYYSFEELRALIPGATGELLIEDNIVALKGITVSSAGNPNMETNANIEFNKIDFTGTKKTAYIQSLDGNYGVRIKTATEDDNTLTRYSKISFSLKGLTLVKENNPERYTLKDLKKEHIFLSEQGTKEELVIKIKSINDLSETDLYTFVRISNVEISLPYGSYVNVHPGYIVKKDWNQQGMNNSGYLDVVPTSIRDNNGGHMNILTNTIAPWCKHTLPTGSGTIDGIIVNSKLLKYGYGEGEIGTYSIRVVEEADIRLENPPQTTTLVEWNWLKNGSDVSAPGEIKKDTEGRVLPALGNGTLDCPVKKAPPALGAHPVFHSNPSVKTVPFSALTYGANWWNTTTEKGEAFLFNFSTLGVMGTNLTINFSQGSGSGTESTLHAPAYWQIEYSTDGTNYQVLPNSTYCVRPLQGWDRKLDYALPGLIDHSFTLPDELFNKENVYIKLKAQKNICGIAQPHGGAEAGLITATSNAEKVNVRVGVVSFKYIK